MWQKIVEWFQNVGHEVVAFFDPLMQAIAANGGNILLQAAEAEVQAAEDASVAALTAGGNALTGEEKFTMAQVGILKTLAANNIPAVLNSINGAIEGAVAKLSAAKTTVATGTAPVTVTTTTTTNVGAPVT